MAYLGILIGVLVWLGLRCLVRDRPSKEEDPWTREELMYVESCQRQGKTKDPLYIKIVADHAAWRAQKEAEREARATQAEARKAAKRSPAAVAKRQRRRRIVLLIVGLLFLAWWFRFEPVGTGYGDVYFVNRWTSRVIAVAPGHFP